MPSPAIPGMVLCFAAAVLFVFASVTPPAWSRYGFLDVTTGSGQTEFGVFGICIKGANAGCSKRSVGYDIVAAGVNNVNLNSKVLHNLTYTLILHPIAGALGFLAMVFGLIGIAAASRVATIFMSILAFLGAVVGLVVFVIDMCLWNILKNRLHDNGYTATLGIANWMTVGGTFALLLATCAAMCGSCGRFATGRSAGEKY